MSDRSVVPLPAGWRQVFWVEIPLVALTLVLWLAAPETYLRDTVGIAAPGPAEVFLLRLYAGTVGSLVFGFYAWLLWQKAVHVPTFRAFQVWLGVGDVAMVVGAALYWSHASRHDLLATQIGLATLWGGLRGWYLWRTR